MDTFAKNSKVVRRNNDRIRLIYIAAVGLSFSLMTLIMLVINYKQDANAGQKQGDRQINEIVTPGSVTLYVPSAKIPQGAKLSDFAFNEVYWPRNQVPDDAILDPSEFKNRYAKVTLAPNVPVLRTHISNELIRQTLPLTPGNRAITVEVDEISGLEGYATPGTHVDVLLSFYEEKILKTSMIVQNARVLSYGGTNRPEMDSAPAANNGMPRRISKSITLDVSPKDAMKIHTARQLGRLGLIMRADDDNKTPDVTEFNAKQISDSEAGAAPSKCVNGSAKVAGANGEIVLGCDGSLNRVEDAREP